MKRKNYNSNLTKKKYLIQTKADKNNKYNILYEDKQYINPKLKKIKVKNKKLKNLFNINLKFFVKFLFMFCLLFFLVKNNLKKLMKLSNKKKDNYFACFSGMGKLENRYVRELIEYYLNLGVEKFILGDNNDPNTEKLSDVIQDYC